MAKILLINPPFYRILGSTNNLVRLQQAVLSAILTERGHEVYQYNADADRPENLRGWKTLYATPIEQYKAMVRSREHPIWKEVEDVIEEIAPDWVGVTVFSGCVEQAARISEIARERNIKTIAGGAHPTTVGNLKLGGLGTETRVTDLHSGSLLLRGAWDAVCVGDGEDAIVRIIEDDWRGVILGGNVRSLDSYPYPEKDNYIGPPWFKQEMLEKGSLLTSRGCKYRCTFCAQNLVAGESMRWHSLEYVMGQLRELVYSYGTTRVTFYDDVFTLAEARVRKLMELIIAEELGLDFRIETRADCLSEETVRLLAKAGCTRVKLGIESGVQEIVDKMNKKLDLQHVVDASARLKKHGIAITGNFILGYPGETDEQAKQTIEFARSLKLDAYSLSLYAAYAGTVDYDKYGGIGLDDPSEQFHTNRNLLALSSVKPETVDQFLALNEGGAT
jgi:radical SAM superfamily enzyme YgiQ (UPF0313 family)